MKDVHIPHPHDEIRNIWPLTSISVRVKIQLSFDKGLKTNLSILSQGTMRVFKIDELGQVKGHEATVININGGIVVNR